jgi:hypothetical protein
VRLADGVIGGVLAPAQPSAASITGRRFGIPRPLLDEPATCVLRRREASFDTGCGDCSRIEPAAPPAASVATASVPLMSHVGEFRLQAALSAATPLNPTRRPI